jgi:hypothetical protein
MRARGGRNRARRASARLDGDHSRAEPSSNASADCLFQVGRAECPGDPVSKISFQGAARAACHRSRFDRDTDYRPGHHHPPAVMPLQPNGSDSAPPGGPSTDVGMPSGRVRDRPARSVHEAEPCSSGMITDLSGLRGLRSSRRHPRFDGAEHDPAGAERNRTAPKPVKTTALTLRRSRSPLREIRSDLREIRVVALLASRFATGSPLTAPVPGPI